MAEDPVVIALVLAGLVFFAEVLARRAFRFFGSALLVILLGAIASNLGLIPSTASTPIYRGIFSYLAPLSIFWLLLQVDLRHVLRAGGAMLGAFVLGAFGTTAGALGGIALAGGEPGFGSAHAPLAGMFVGTYVGGSINFNAIALEYGLVTDGGLYAGAVAIDNILTAVWMIACLAAPVALAPLWWRRRRALVGAGAEPGLGPSLIGHDDTETLGPGDFALLLLLGLAAMRISAVVVDGLGRLGLEVPEMLVLTALALVVGHLPFAHRIRGARALGMFSVQAFLAVIGALCSLAALERTGELGVRLAVLAGVTVFVHGLVVFGGAWLLRLDLGVVAVASQANVGGGTSALALARSIGRPELAVPGILVGSLGTAAGTFLGFAVAGWLGA